jgi:hypothetical protein
MIGRLYAISPRLVSTAFHRDCRYRYYPQQRKTRGTWFEVEVKTEIRNERLVVFACDMMDSSLWINERILSY